MSWDSDLARIIKRAEAQRIRHRMTEKNHHQFFFPDNGPIVVTAGTSSSEDGWRNFLAEMKRSGYVGEGLMMLGEFLPAKPVVPEAANGHVQLSVTQHVTDLLSRHQEGCWPQEINAYIKTVRPDVSEAAYSNACARLVERGILIREGGKYKTAPSAVSVDTAMAVELIKAPQVPQAPTPLVGGQRTGDATIDADLEALDNALVALSQIEGVVRRNREVLQQLATLKKLLGGIK